MHSLEDYRRFLAVSDHRSISAAADALNISQPALSRSIRLLEDRFATSLFTRSGQGVELTEAGKILFVHAHRATRSIEGAREEIMHSVLKTELVLRICSGAGWGFSILPAIVRDFLSDHPDCSVQLDVIANADRARGLETRNYDLAFGVISPEFIESGKFQLESLCAARNSVYCHQNHPLVGQAGIDDEDLQRYRWIQHKFEYDYDQVTAPRPNTSFALRTGSLLVAMETIRNSSLLMSASKIMRPAFARMEIVPLMDDPHTETLQSGLITLTGIELRPLARKFVRYVRNAVQRLDLDGTYDRQASTGHTN